MGWSQTRTLSCHKQFVSLVFLFILIKHSHCLSVRGIDGQQPGISESYWAEASSHLIDQQICVSLFDNETDGPECNNYHNSTWNQSVKCEFINTTEDCEIDDGFVNYLEVVYCRFSENLVPLALTLLVLWLLFLFVSLGVTAESFFCPSLTEISRALRLNDNIAGVTFLAFGNGAPDIFSAVAASKNGDTDLIIGALFGAAIFITTVVAGSVALTQPVKIEKWPFVRDIVFNLGAGFWTFWIYYRAEIKLGEAVGFIGLYIVYVFVVLFGHVGRKIYEHPQFRRTLSVPEQEENDENRILVESASQIEDNRPTVIVQGENIAIRRLLHGINPIDTQNWKQKSFISKCFAIIKIPIQFMLLLTVPKVDHSKELHDWNKLLNVLQIITGVMLSVFITEAGFFSISGSFYVWELILPVCVLLAVVVFFTSKIDEPPVYHFLFPYLAFAVSVVWIYTLANEIVNLLQMIGVEFGLSTASLGLTLLAWGNCIGDLVSNLTITKQGSPRMAFAACFGGPLLNILLGIGLSCTIAAARSKHGVFCLDHDPIHYVLAAGLGASLLFSLISMVCARFNTTRLYGILVYVLYVCFLTVALLTEYRVIKE